MRRVYFVRHGLPELPGGERMCIGTTDVPLSSLGRLQAYTVGAYLRGVGFSAVFSSPLTRALDTAKMLSREPVIMADFRELYAGEWEGLSFSRIKAEWPELYAARGSDMDLVIPGSEDISEVSVRFSDAVDAALACSEGDIVIVSHMTAIRSYFCRVQNISMRECRAIPLPHCSVSVMEVGEGKEFTLIGGVHATPLSRDFCLGLMKAAGADEKIIRHCECVADKAGEIAEALNLAGYSVNRELIEHSALLHDIARSEPDHAGTGGKWLELLGYPEIGRLIALHHDIISVQIDEAAVLAMADRCVFESEPIAIEERFSRSIAKCRDEEALKAHSERYENAKALQSLFNSACGKQIIP